MTEPVSPAPEPSGPTPPAPPERAVDLGRPRQPPLRLPVWVVIALLITMFASCSAANSASEAASSVQDSRSTSGSTTLQEVEAMCRLLGAVAAKQGVDLDTAFGGPDSSTTCAEVARQAAQP